MAATIYLRDGGPLVIPEAAATEVEVVLTATGFRTMLACRDPADRVVAQFDEDAVLAFRCPRRGADGAPGWRPGGPRRARGGA